MTITNTLLNEIAKSLNGESYVIPGYLAISTDTSLSSIDITDTTLSGETSPRLALTGSRSDNSIEFTAVRTGSTVSTSSGEVLYGTGLFSGLSSSDLMAGLILPGITHTTNFDIEFVTTLNVTR